MVNDLARHINNEKVLEQIDVMKAAMLFRDFTRAHAMNISHRNFRPINELIESLTEKLTADLDQVQERTVFLILQGVQNYQYMIGFDRFSSNMIAMSRQLTNFVVNMAIENPALVQANFIVELQHQLL